MTPPAVDVGRDRGVVAKIAYALLAFGVAVLAGGNAGLNVFGANATALAGWPGADPTRSLIDAANAMTMPEQGTLAATARQSLRHQALNPVALRILGISAENQGRQPSKYFVMADRLSRREPLTQLWLLEHGVLVGDIDAVLKRYDILMSTSPELNALLFPVLDGALSNADVRTKFIKQFAIDRPWTMNFMNYAAATGSNPANITRAILATGGLTRAIRYQIDAKAIMRRLIDMGEAPLMARLYASLPSHDPQIMSSLALNDRSIDQAYAPPAWELTQSANTSVFPELGQNGALALDISSASDTIEIAVAKVLLLPKGAYRLQWQVVVERAGPEANAHWEAVCPGTSALTAIPPGPNVLESGNNVGTMTIDLPQGCRAVRIQLRSSGGQDPNGSAFKLSNVKLARA